MADLFYPMETEVVLVSYIFHDYDLNMIYEDTVLNIVKIHKHLGIYLSAKAYRFYNSFCF